MGSLISPLYDAAARPGVTLSLRIFFLSSLLRRGRASAGGQVRETGPMWRSFSGLGDRPDGLDLAV